MLSRPWLVSAALYFVSFRPLRFFPLAWIAAVPLIQQAQGKSAWQRFRIGYLFGLASFLAINYWIPVATFNARWLVGFSDVWAIFIAFIAWFLSSMMFAFYPALTTLVGLTAREPGRVSPLRFACAWTAAEWLHSLGPLGLTWGSAGLTQRPWLGLIQNADLFGVYGISFLIALVNASLAFKNRSWRLASVALVVLFWARGTFVTHGTLEDSQKQTTVALVQPAVPIREKVDPENIPENLPMLERITREAASAGVELVVWPETMLPVSWSLNPHLQARVHRLAAEAGIDLLIGTNEQQSDKEPLFNQAVLMTPAGQQGLCRKSRLVPFGEYLPLRRQLPLLTIFSPEGTDYCAGEPGVPLVTRRGRAGVLICFESTFSDLARNMVRAGAEFLVVMTNDDWFLGTSAIGDHSDFAVFRAIETRRWLAQAANSGETLVISPQGEIVRRMSFARRGFLKYKISSRAGWTLSVRFGEWVAIASALLSLLFFGSELRRVVRGVRA